MAAECVKVIVRCRPMNAREKNLNCEECLEMDRSVMQCKIQNPSEKNAPPKTFTFDGVYFTDSTTEQIYTEIAYPLVESVLEGYNGTIFAYGQTGCGKSFTMQGIKDPPTQNGLIPRAFRQIFQETEIADNTKYLITASYLEIYNEDIRDLLGKDTKKKLDLKEHPERGVFVQDLSKHPVHNVQDCELLMDKGWNNRATGETNMNAESSRSHSIFAITVEMIQKVKNKESIRQGKLNLVDLAGSERQSKTGATGDRLKEATKINLSLSALGNVISALAMESKGPKHIPYRDSKLTRILQDSLGGNTKTMMVACLSPADNNYDETLSTLRYANRAKEIKNKPKINEDPKDAMLREYQEEIKKLKSLLDEAGGPPKKTVEKVVDEDALKAEREKITKEYEAKIKTMHKQLEGEKKGNIKLQEQMAKLKNKFDSDISKVDAKRLGVDTSNLPPGVTLDDLIRLEELQGGIVGGERKEDIQLREKRKKQKAEVEKRVREIAEAHGRGLRVEQEDDDSILLKAYDDINDTLKARTEIAKKLKRQLRASEREIKDLTQEFEADRMDYLETIRRQDQQIKLLQQILDKVQPTVRKDCNYSDLDQIKKEARWVAETGKWIIPDLNILKTKLPPAASGPSDTTAKKKFDWSQHMDKVKKKLEKGEEENIAGKYFQSNTGNRQLEILKSNQEQTLKVANQDKEAVDQKALNLCSSNPLASVTPSPSPRPSASNLSLIGMDSRSCPPSPTFSFSPEMSIRKPTRLAPVERKKNTMDTL